MLVAIIFHALQLQISMNLRDITLYAHIDSQYSIVKSLRILNTCLPSRSSAPQTVKNIKTHSINDY